MRQHQPLVKVFQDIFVKTFLFFRSCLSLRFALLFELYNPSW
jgi:hypothetical protein